MEALLPVLKGQLLVLAAGLLLAALWSLRLHFSVAEMRLNAGLNGLERRLNRPNRSVGTRVYRGLVFVLFAAGLAAGFGLALQWLGAQSAWLAPLEALVVAYLLPVRALRDKAAAVGRAVKRGELARARGLAEGLSRREMASPDVASLLRVSLEYLAENFNDKLLAPAFWYVLLGLPALCAVRMVNLLDGRIGHKSVEHLAFGWAAARLDDVLMWVPARLSALFLVVAALFVPRGRVFGALKTALTQARNTASPNAGWPLAAMAGALHVSLAGPRLQAGVRIDDAWIGSGSAKLSYGDFRRGLTLYAVACLLVLLAVLIAVALLSGIALI